MSEFINPTIAKNFYDNGIEQLNQRVVGEVEAKSALLTGMVAGLNIVFTGKPGGAKTLLAETSPHLVHGIEEENFVGIDGISDIAPTRVVGGDVVTTHTTEHEDGSRTRESKSVTIDAMVTPETQVVFLDEINRMSSHAVNSLMRALETRRIRNSAGEVELKQLEFIISTMNPSESRNSNVFPMSPAVASRHAVGALVGEKQGREEVISSMLDDPDETGLIAVTDLDTLHEIRRFARYGKMLGDSLKKSAGLKVAATVDMLEDLGMEESDGRFARQVSRLAKTDAVLKGEDYVGEENLHQALRYVAAARAGILSTRKVTAMVLLEVDKLF